MPLWCVHKTMLIEAPDEVSAAQTAHATSGNLPAEYEVYVAGHRPTADSETVLVTEVDATRVVEQEEV